MIRFSYPLNNCRPLHPSRPHAHHPSIHLSPRSPARNPIKPPGSQVYATQAQPVGTTRKPPNGASKGKMSGPQLPACDPSGPLQSIPRSPGSPSPFPAGSFGLASAPHESWEIKRTCFSPPTPPFNKDPDLLLASRKCFLFAPLVR